MIQNLLSYLIKGLFLTLASYFFSFFTEWLTGKFFQIILQVFLLAFVLYFLDNMIGGFLPQVARLL